MKISILIPVYNDWESVSELIKNIDIEIKDLNHEFSIIIINDASLEKKELNFQSLENINLIELIHMKENRGHARCNAFGIRYIFLNKEFDYIILMDGDGEDRPVEIKSLVKKINENPNVSVVAKRVKRSEGPFFQLLYQAHKLITVIFTGKNIDFGNYSILTKVDAGKLHSKASLWSSFSGSVKKYLTPLNEINSFRGSRYFGPSKMSFFKLIIHSLSIIAVFKYQVFLRSTLIIIALAYLNLYLGSLSVFLQILIVIFNLLIFVASRRELEKDLINSQNNLSEIKNITH